MLNLVTALPCEAKPLIEHWHLKKICDKQLPFPIFVNKEQTIHLIISGVGKTKAAMATTFLHLFTGSQTTHCFLNIGIAGSTEFPLGKCLIAHKIIEASTQRCWYPFVSLLKNKPQSVLVTHDTPQQVYPAAGLVDMEGSAFFQAASHYVTQEQIQIIKIVSDNDAHSLNKINQDSVKNLIKENLPMIIEIVQYQMNMEQQTYLPEITIKEFQLTWYFTYAQLIQLKEYLRRWEIQIKNENPWVHCQNEANAERVIAKMIKRLDDHANCLR